MRKSIIAFVFFLAYFFLITPILSQDTPSQSIPSTGEILYNVHRLKASGTTIEDGFGNKIVLVGTQIDYNEYSSGYFTIQDLQKMKSYGGNCVEFHGLIFNQLMPQRGVIDETYFFNNLDEWISLCEQTQIYYIINLRNFKWVSYGACMPDWMLEGHGYGSPPYNEAIVDQACIDFWDVDNPLHDDNRQSFILLWSFIANRYKNNQYALFGIINEPLCGVNLNATQASHLGTTYSRFMEEVVDRIRSVGADHLVFIDRPYVCAVPQYYGNIQPVNRTNVVWEDHLYVTAENWGIHSFSEWESIMTNQKIPRFVGDFQKPLYIGEYGPYPINMTDWRNIIAKQIAFLKSSEVAGYSWHTWGFLKGEYYDPIYGYLNQEESDYILQTIYG